MMCEYIYIYIYIYIFIHALTPFIAIIHLLTQEFGVKWARFLAVPQGHNASRIRHNAQRANHVPPQNKGALVQMVHGRGVQRR